MAPSISIREYIRWVPDRSSEPTNTLVLTSAENRFVDIRILKPTQSSDSEVANEHVLPFTRLDWAFAGTSESNLHQDPSGKQLVHSKWTHWIDSHSLEPEKVNDEGDMFPQKDGTTLEKGSMVNPATGRMTDYEELWKDVEPISTHEDGRLVNAVLVLHDDSHNTRGMVVRVGQYCQGFMRIGEHMTLEQWAWTGEGKWKRTARMGDLWIPCGVALEEGKIKIDGKVKYGDYEWKVVELSEFSLIWVV